MYKAIYYRFNVRMGIKYILLGLKTRRVESCYKLIVCITKFRYWYYINNS